MPNKIGATRMHRFLAFQASVNQLQNFIILLHWLTPVIVVDDLSQHTHTTVPYAKCNLEWVFDSPV